MNAAKAAAALRLLADALDESGPAQSANHTEPERPAKPLTVQEIADARQRARRRGLLRT